MKIFKLEQSLKSEAKRQIVNVYKGLGLNPPDTVNILEVGIGLLKNKPFKILSFITNLDDEVITLKGQATISSYIVCSEILQSKRRRKLKHLIKTISITLIRKNLKDYLIDKEKNRRSSINYLYNQL